MNLGSSEFGVRSSELEFFNSSLHHPITSSPHHPIISSTVNRQLTTNNQQPSTNN
ncbi:MAG: hypothetical protein QNJ51_16105 [Calothrix sp. MO_167.B12]|nr:hypothetical protein [Calothrix sp. MO_167.B12]